MQTPWRRKNVYAVLLSLFAFITGVQMVRAQEGPIDEGYVPRSLMTAPALPGFELAVAVGAAPEYTPTLQYSGTSGICWEPLAAVPEDVQRSLDASTIGDFLVVRRADNMPRILATARRPPMLYRTGDLGRTWALQQVAPTCDSLRLAASPVPDYQIYASANDYCQGIETSGAYLYASTDAGETWEALKLPGEKHTGRKHGWWIVQVVPSPVVAQRLYLYMEDATDASHKWYRSDDAGNSWEQLTWEALTTYTLAFVPDPVQKDLVYIWANGGAGYRRTGNVEVAWRETPRCELPRYQGKVQLVADPVRSGVLYMSCMNGLFVSEDGGDSWQHRFTDPFPHLAPDYGQHRMLLWREDGIYASQGDSSKWQRLSDETTRCSNWSYLPVVRR